MSEEIKKEAQDVEALQRSAVFSNPVHKEARHTRLFGEMQTLELDDLAMVAGGLSEPFVLPEEWPDEERVP